MNITHSERLAGVHPDLVRVVNRCATLSPIAFMVVEGLRTASEEAANVATHASTTMHSRHLDGHAVDLGAMPSGVLSWESHWYSVLADAMRRAAAIENVAIEWGGSWNTFKDFGHFQLPWAEYP